MKHVIIFKDKMMLIRKSFGYNPGIIRVLRPKLYSTHTQVIPTLYPAYL